MSDDEKWKHNREARMGRLRIWLDDDTKAAFDWLRTEMRVGPTRITAVALSLLRFALIEKKNGRKLITVDSDGTNPREVM